MSTPDLERLARETAARIETAQRNYLNSYPSEATPVDLEDIILSALRAAQSAQNEDTARIDWLDHNCPTYSVGRTLNVPENPDPMPFAFKYGLGSRAKNIPFRGSVRAAIDQARGEG